MNLTPSRFRLSLLSIAATVVLAGLCPARANGEATEQKKLIVKVFALPNPRSTSVLAQGERAVVNAFHEKYPDIELRAYSGISIEGMAMDSRPLMAIAGRMSPDVLYVNFRQSDTYIRNGFLEPLDRFISPEQMEELHESRVPKPAWPVIRREGPRGETRIWALPQGALVRALQYRKDLFAECGLDPERPPENWEELEEYARKLTRPDKGTFGLMFTQSEAATSWDWIGFLWSLGGDAVVQNEEGEWRAAFDCDASARSLLYYIRLQTQKWTDSSGRVQEGFTCRETPQFANEKWLEGKIGMRLAYLEQDQIGRDIDPAVTGIAPVPLGYPLHDEDGNVIIDPETGEPKRIRGSELNCRMMGMFSDIQARDGFTREEIQEAAFKWIWFVDSEEARRIRTRVFVEAGYGKLYNPVYLKKYGYEEYLELVPDNWLPVFEEALRNGKPEPYGRNCQLVYKYMSEPLNEAMELETQGRLGDTTEEKLATIRRLLKRAVEKTNKEMIGLITPEERQKRNHVAAIVGTIMVAAFLVVLWRVWNTFRPPEAEVHGGWGFRKYWPAYVIMLPAVLSIVTWRYAPMLMGSKMVFQDYNVVGESAWTGLENLGDVLWDPTWWSSLVKTIYYMALMLGLGFCVPIVLAILLTEVSFGKMAYRTIFYLPAVLSGMVVLYLWKLMYDPSDIGVFNQLIARLDWALAKVGIPGIGAQKWLRDPQLAMLCCVLPSIWAGAGPKCLLYLAALKTVPDDLYEAADLDNCGFLKKVWHITLPTLKGLIIINFIGEFIVASQNTRMILVLTFGGPQDATKVAGLHIFEKAYLYLRFGTATTMAWMLGIMMLGFTTIQLKRLSRMEFTTAGQMDAKKQGA